LHDVDFRASPQARGAILALGLRSVWACASGPVWGVIPGRILLLVLNFLGWQAAHRLYLYRLTAGWPASCAHTKSPPPKFGGKFGAISWARSYRLQSRSQNVSQATPDSALSRAAPSTAALPRLVIIWSTTPARNRPGAPTPSGGGLLGGLKRAPWILAAQDRQSIRSPPDSCLYPRP